MGNVAEEAQKAVHEQPPPLAPNQYLIRIDKASMLHPDKKIGIDIVKSKIDAPRACLKVMKVKEDGLIAEWNKMNPNIALECGAIIVKVNGASVTCDQMLADIA